MIFNKLVSNVLRIPLFIAGGLIIGIILAVLLFGLIFSRYDYERVNRNGQEVLIQCNKITGTCQEVNK